MADRPSTDPNDLISGRSVVFSGSRDKKLVPLGKEGNAGKTAVSHCTVPSRIHKKYFEQTVYSEHVTKETSLEALTRTDSKTFEASTLISLAISTALTCAMVNGRKRFGREQHELSFLRGALSC